MIRRHANLHVKQLQMGAMRLKGSGGVPGSAGQRHDQPFTRHHRWQVGCLFVLLVVLAPAGAGGTGDDDGGGAVGAEQCVGGTCRLQTRDRDEVPAEIREKATKLFVSAPRAATSSMPAVSGLSDTPRRTPASATTPCCTSASWTPPTMGWKSASTLPRPTRWQHRPGSGWGSQSRARPNCGAAAAGSSLSSHRFSGWATR